MHNIETELVTEYAKDLVWEERYRTFKNQFYLYGKQQHRLWRASGKVDIIVTDAPLLHNNIYSYINKTDDSNKFHEYVFEEVARYNNINFFIERVKPYLEYGRNQKEADARMIDNYIRDYLSQHGVTYIPIPGNYHGVNIAVSKIFSLLNLGKKTLRISESTVNQEEIIKCQPSL